MRTKSPLVALATTILLVGCAHGSPATVTTFIPDDLRGPPTAQRHQPVQQEAGEQSRPVAHQNVATSSTRAGRLPVGGAARLRDDSRSPAYSSAGVANTEPHAQQGKTTSNGKKGNPALLNLPMLIKMGGIANMGAKRSASNRDDSHERRLSANRVSDRSKTKNPMGMLNLPMLIKMGGIARLAENAQSKSRKGNPALLNVTMLIKMGGVVRGLERTQAHQAKLRTIPEQITHGGMQLPEAVQERRDRVHGLRSHPNLNVGKTFRRQQLGGRCVGPRCDN